MKETQGLPHKIANTPNNAPLFFQTLYGALSETFEFKNTFQSASSLDKLLACILALAPLPSLAGLSVYLKTHLGFLFNYMGPLNLVKLTLPLLLYNLILKLKSAENRLKYRLKNLGWILLAGSVCTLLAAEACFYPPEILREWVVILTGFLCAVQIILLPSKWVRYIILCWAGWIYGFALLDLISPATIDTLYEILFDADTRKQDLAEVGNRVLTGVFGRQSLAKLLCWLPCTGLFVYSITDLRQNKARTKLWNIFWGALFLLSMVWILMTSQRGPLIGLGSGALVLLLHRIFKSRDYKTAGIIGTGLVAACIGILLFVPHDLLRNRMGPLLEMAGAKFERVTSNPAATQAALTQNFRIQMALFSIERTLHYPLGSACITPVEFFGQGIQHPSHAHNLILQQFRERGWVWGALHLWLWIQLCFAAFRSRTFWGSALAALATAHLVSGLFDHPWWVLSHSIPIAFALVSGWILSDKRFSKNA